MIDDFLNETTNECIPPKKYSHEWNSKLLKEKIEDTFHLDLPIDSWINEEGVDEE